MRRKIAILGGGISGLSAAWFLKKKYGKAVDLILFEKSNRLGGSILTLKHAEFLFEAGPRGFRPAGKGKETLDLVRAIGLEPELIPSNPRAKKRYLYFDGALHPITLKFLVGHGLISALWNDLVTRRTPNRDESIAAFAEKRCPRPMIEKLIDPLVLGIFGGDIHKLSLPACFPNMCKRSVIRSFFTPSKGSKNKVPLLSFRLGMQQLTDVLGQKFEGSLHLETSVESLKNNGQKFNIHTRLGVFSADTIISALPDRENVRLLHLPNTIEEYVTLSTINLGWRKPVLQHQGFGFLVPTKEKKEILGVTFDSEIFPEHGNTRMCVMVRGERSEQELVKIARTHLLEILKINQEPEVTLISTAQHAIPQYTLGHLSRVARLRESVPPHFHAIGNAYAGVGVNDCIECSAQTIRKL